MFTKLFFVCLAIALCNAMTKSPMRRTSAPVHVDWNENNSPIDSRIRDDYLEKYGNSIYKYHRNPKTFVQAQLVCDAEGTHLAVVNSLDEANFLVSLMNRNPASDDVQYKNYVLVGFHSAFEPQVYMTIQGQSLKRAGYTIFGANKPANNGRCGALYRDGTLSEYPCQVKSPFVCEYSTIDNVSFAGQRNNDVRHQSQEHHHEHSQEHYQVPNQEYNQEHYQNQ